MNEQTNFSPEDIETLLLGLGYDINHDKLTNEEFNEWRTKNEQLFRVMFQIVLENMLGPCDSDIFRKIKLLAKTLP